MLAETVQHNGGTVPEGSGTVPEGNSIPRGVSRKHSHQWQRVASLPGPVFEEELAKPEPTTAGMLRLTRVRARGTSESVGARHWEPHAD